MGVPRKNIRPLLGKSLVQRAYEGASESGVFDRIILSTDDPEIADHARGMGLEVPFLRPEAIAQSTTAMIDVVEHALASLHSDFDSVMLLQPTSPLRTPRHIKQAVEELPLGDSVCSVLPVPKTHCPHYVMKIEDGNLDYFLEEGKNYTRRQDVPQAYTREGTIFLATTDVIRTTRSFYGKQCRALLMDPSESLSIDTEEDWAEAERRLSRHGS